MASRKRSLSNDADIPGLQKEWDEVLCPICMDHPHNAVLIICSSHEMGCRSFICDTSYRHSNCLDRFKKLKQENTDTENSPPTSFVAGNDANPVDQSSRDLEFEGGETGMAGHDSEHNIEESQKELAKLRCPLCRGDVLSWKVVEDARKYLNLKSRSCSHESCSFSGNYVALRKHARKDHPQVRPADVDPSRQREWHRLEGQRELNDIVSAIRSAMPGAVLVGDYAIESGDRDRPFIERVRSGSGADHGRWLSTFFLVQMIGSLEDRAPTRSGRSRGVLGHRHSTPPSRHPNQYLWGENLLGLEGEMIEEEDDDEEDVEEDEQDLNVPSDLGNNRRRRARYHYRSDGDYD